MSKYSNNDLINQEIIQRTELYQRQKRELDELNNQIIHLEKHREVGVFSDCDFSDCEECSMLDDAKTKAINILCEMNENSEHLACLKDYSEPEPVCSVEEVSIKDADQEKLEE